MNGILCVDKPEGFTSFDVVAKLRGMLKTRKIGHAGTLDPMATGVLPLLIGNATKACDMLPVQDKRYTAVFRLGIVTDTQDITGTVLETRPVSASKRDVEDALAGFQGEIRQVPPMYSAVQVGGRRLYDLARQGVEIKRDARLVTIHTLALLAADDVAREYTVDVACSKGTYIRSLCHDLGELLGSGAVLAALRRTEACGYSLADCVTIEELQVLAGEGHAEEHLLPVDSAFAAYPKLTLDQEQARLLFQGAELTLGRTSYAGDTAYVTVYGPEGGFLAIGFANRASDSLRSLKWFGLTH